MLSFSILIYLYTVVMGTLSQRGALEPGRALDPLLGAGDVLLLQLLEVRHARHHVVALRRVPGLELLDPGLELFGPWDEMEDVRGAIVEAGKKRVADHAAKTLFATHYHELTDLADALGGVVNFHVAAREWKDDIIFLHKILPGRSDRSYGIQVARLAGVECTAWGPLESTLQATIERLSDRVFVATASGRLAAVSRNQWIAMAGVLNDILRLAGA